MVQDLDVLRYRAYKERVQVRIERVSGHTPGQDMESLQPGQLTGS